MLFLQNPAWLWGLAAVGAVAAWALFRPARQLAVVGSLELWQEALDHLDRSQHRRAKRVTLPWLLLLAGAVAAVSAAARPALLSSAPARSVTIALYPSAEIAQKPGMDALRRAATGLLDRLSGEDRVQLLLPGGDSGPARWVSVLEARSRVEKLRPVPVPAGELPMPTPDAAAQHVYRIVPAGAGLPPAPGQTVIEVPTVLPDVTLDSLAAAVLPDGNVQVFLAAHNHLANAWSGRASVTGRLDPKDLAAVTLLYARWWPGTTPVILSAAPKPAMEVTITKIDGPQDGFSGYLVRRESAAVRVAFVGDDDPLIRRFVKVNPELALVSEPADADVIVCVGQEAPAGKAALVIRPPAAPPGCTAAGNLRNLVLGDEGVSVESQDPVLLNVDLAGVAVRSAAPWQVKASANLKTLCGVKGGAVLARTTPELQPAEAGEARRIYVAFGTDTENTNFATTESFVIFLANAFRWLSPPPAGRSTPASAPATPHATAPARYEYVSPRQAAYAGDWRRIEPPPGTAGDEPWAEGPYPPPGIYRDGRGVLHAVSLVGLCAAEPNVPPADAVSAAPLPAPRSTGATRELWTWLALAAMALWLAGWAARMR